MARAVRARPTDAPREAPVGSARGSEIVLTGRCPLRARCHSTRATPRPGRKFGPMTPLLSAVRFHSVLADSPQSATSQVTQTSSRLHRPFALRCTRRMRHRPRRTRLTGDRRRRPRLDRGTASRWPVVESSVPGRASATSRADLRWPSVHHASFALIVGVPDRTR